MLQSVRVVDFKGLRDLTVELGQFTVLVGPNAVGKTTVLEALFLGRFFRRDGSDELEIAGRDHPRKHENFIRNGAQEARVELRSDGTVYAYTLDRRPIKPGTRKLKRENGEWEPWKSEFYLSESESLGRISWLRLDAEHIAAPATASASSEPPPLGFDGSGLAVFLQYLLGLRDGTFETIEKAVTSVVPRFRKMQFRPSKVVESLIRVHTMDGKEVEVPFQREHTGLTTFLNALDEAIVPHLFPGA